jgi:oxygen-independent coproporphyrinogen-3 oxidase
MSSLYLHIPFCSSKCPYCDFYSQVGSAQQVADYVALLMLDLQLLARSRPHSAPLRTVFFGGGTPSLLTAGQAGRLLRQIEHGFGFAADCEISLEANPGSLDAERLGGYRAAGINRLSLGVQSLCDRQLKQLGRGHTAEDARRAVAQARAAGFDNLSLDLMFGRPGQTGGQLTQELEGLLALQPQHVSLYGLSYETGTPFAARLQRGELSEATEEEYAEQYLLLRRLLTTAGFEHYEISNFARPGYRCKHNQVYWRRGSCLAAGCGAHSFDAAGWGERRAVPPDLERYRRCLAQGRDPSERLETFDRRGAMAETLYLALRTADGVDAEAFAATFGSAPEAAFPAAFAQLSDQLRRHGQRWRFQAKSWLLYDHLISRFL